MITEALATWWRPALLVAGGLALALVLLRAAFLWGRRGGRARGGAVASQPIQLSRDEARSLGAALATMSAALWIAFGLPDLGQPAAAAWGSALTILIGAWWGTRVDPPSIVAARVAEDAARLVAAHPSAYKDDLASAIRSRYGLAPVAPDRPTP